jgi:glycosyltransferase involved in cell wall biosynthesis
MNGVVVESDFAANWVDLRYPDIPKAIIPHAVSSDFLNAGISECKGMQVLCVGSFLPQKGHDTVLKALALCRNQSIHLCLVGAGVLRDEYERLIHGLKLDHRVVFAGVLSREQIISKMKQSFCLVMPSRMDTSPNVVTEAQAMGLPVIGSRAGGIPDLISEGIDGFLFDVDNEVELAECLDRLSGDSGKCRDLGQRGRQRVVDKHHPDVVARQHAGFFRSLVNAK